MRKCLAVALLLTGCSSFETQDDWSKADTNRMWATYAAIATDAITTQRIQDDPAYVEGGALAHTVLGPEPQTAETIAYMAAVAFVYRALSKRLPPKWRRVVQYIGIAEHSVATLDNCDKGLC